MDVERCYASSPHRSFDGVTTAWCRTGGRNSHWLCSGGHATLGYERRIRAQGIPYCAGPVHRRSLARIPLYPLHGTALYGDSALGSAPITLCEQDTNAYLREYYPLILRLAQRIQDGLPSRNAYDDLVQAGMLAAWACAGHHQRFAAPQEFVKLLAVRIRGAMLDLLREEDWAPRRLRKKNKTLEIGAAHCIQRLQRYPNDQELAEAMGWSVHELHQHWSEIGRAAPLYLEDVLPAHSELMDDTAQPHHRAERDEAKTFLTEAIAALSEEERTALSLYVLEELTLEDVAYVMGFKSKNTALKWVTQGITKCRAFLLAQGLDAESV